MGTRIVVVKTIHLEKNHEASRWRKTGRAVGKIASVRNIIKILFL